MNRSFLPNGLPLVTRELVEQAARKRTYVTRVLFAIFLFVSFLVASADVYSGHLDPREALGSGRQLFTFLITLQFAAIFLFLPALMTGAITQEKERESLSLLLLTRLRPREIVLEKFVGRLIPFLTMQLAALPLLAIVQSLGGVSQATFWSGVYLVLLASLQVGSFSLLMSVVARTTAGAFALTYLAGAALYAVVVVTGHAGYGHAALLWVPALFARADGATFAECYVTSLPALASVAAFLVAASVLLIPRAHVARRNHVLEFFRWLDRRLYAINERVGGVVLFRDRSDLPGDHPVAWRELNRKALGSLRYTIRLVLAIEIPVACVCAAAVFGSRRDLDRLSVTVCVVWGLAVAILGVFGTQAILSERSQETLGVLLSTPLSRREIVRQKLAGIWRLAGILWAPFLTLFASKWFLLRSYADEGLAARYLVSSCLLVLIYQPLFVWLAVWIGLRSTARLRSTLLYLGVATLWIALPGFVHAAAGPLGGEGHALLLLSPASMLLATESSWVSSPHAAGLSG
ncbi:MAG: ABC transporter permease subunit, partial [Planctomycetota bacterium]|nr:ABC transporter permease subunit [Planctomycetota bacterium]